MHVNSLSRLSHPHIYPKERKGQAGRWIAEKGAFGRATAYEHPPGLS